MKCVFTGKHQFIHIPRKIQILGNEPWVGLRIDYNIIGIRDSRIVGFSSDAIPFFVSVSFSLEIGLQVLVVFPPDLLIFLSHVWGKQDGCLETRVCLHGSVERVYFPYGL